MMVGPRIDQLFPEGRGQGRRARAGGAGPGAPPVVRGVSLTVRAGEIVGLAGLVGSGRSEVAQTMFGITPATSGEILLAGEPVRIDQRRRRPSATASPTCPRTAAPRAWSGR